MSIDRQRSERITWASGTDLLRQFRGGVLILAFASGLGGFAHAQQLNKGWWVIVGTCPTEPWQRMATDSQRVNAAASRCDVETFNDFSATFRGFTPGYNVFVMGAFATRGKAEDAVRAVGRCFPEAYVRYGECLGE